ncbi:MAG: nucleoside 2-deoxyribosyltransferase [Rubrobacteraceae bacterium]
MQNQNADNSAFILMPFDIGFEPIYSELIKPALEEAGFNVHRADSTLDQQNILRTIVHSIDNADLVIAELTTSNPNVFYELGIAHGLRKPVVLLSQELEQVPFDLRSYKIVTYSTHFDEVHKLKDSLKTIARGIIENSVSFGSPVQDFARSTIGSSTVHSGVFSERVEETRIESGEHEEDLGIFDYVDEAENSIEQIASIVTEFTEIIEGFGERTYDLASKAQELSESGHPASAIQMRKVTAEVAKEISRLGDGIGNRLQDFHQEWESMEKSFAGLLSKTEIGTIEDREQALELLSQLEEFRASISPGLSGLQEAREALSSNTGLSKDLNVAIRGTVKVMDELIEELSTGESSLSRMTNLLDQKIQDSS